MDPDDPARFGSLLRQHRLAAGMTQEALAEHAGMSARAIQELERGRRQPLLDTFRRLLHALELSQAAKAEFVASAMPGPIQPRSASSPALASGVPSNLPASLTSFVGREDALAEVAAALTTARLVTLVGVGGVGKTRLALETAAGTVDRFPDGVWLAEIAPFNDPALVPWSVAAVLGVHEAPGRPITDALVAALQQRRVLLVLDNCEHLVDACARLADAVLRRCPDVRVLATSREPLGIRGETAWRVPSLTAPDPMRPLDTEALGRYEAVQLFVERARSLQPRFALTEGNAAAVAQVCWRLDGIPLALELAAARLRLVTVEHIAARLDQRFQILTGGSRTALPRQQTLRSAIDWSYDLLTEHERALLRRLAVFAGGWTLEAAVEVGGAGLAEGEQVLELKEWVVLDLLTSLVDKSLVVVDEPAPPESAPIPAYGPLVPHPQLPTPHVRYRLLETIRQYAEEKLLEAGEAAAVRWRHLRYFTAWSERTAPEPVARDQLMWYRRFAADYDNVRAALAWGRSEDQGTELELRLAAALGLYWTIRGHGSEGRAWLADALARSPTTPGVARATALNWAGALELQNGELHKGRALLTASVAMSRELGDGSADSVALRHLAMACLAEGDLPGARRFFDEALAAARHQGDAREVAMTLARLGHIDAEEGDVEAARRRLDESLAIGRETGDALPNGVALMLLGRLEVTAGQYDRAQARFEEALSQGQAIEYKQFTSSALMWLGELARMRGDQAAARTRFRESLSATRKRGEDGPAANCLLFCAALDAESSRFERAARLYGAVDAWRAGSRAPASWMFFPVKEHDRHLAAARGGLGDSAFAAAWAAGRALTLEEAIADALDDGAWEYSACSPRS